MIKIIAAVLGAFWIFSLYCCLVVGKRADEETERFLDREKHVVKEQKEE